MSEVTPGRGIQVMKQSGWINGHEVVAAEISVGYIDPDQLNTLEARPGEVLMFSDNGRLEWKQPFDSDKELRNEYPALEEAWGILMEALSEYELVKKLVKDHEKS